MPVVYTRSLPRVARSSATSTGGRAASSFRIRCATRSGPCSSTAPTARSTSSSSRTANGSSGSEIKGSAVSGSPSGSCPSTPSSGASARDGPCRSYWTSGPTTSSDFAIRRYLGWRHERVTGAEDDSFIEQFVQAFREELPGTLLQWEDFGAAHARPILERYREHALTFNDYIQGTGAIALAAILSALHITALPLREQRIVILGAGSAGVGVADTIRGALLQDGLTEAEARQHFFLVNRGGLLHTGREDLKPEQREYARPWGEIDSWSRHDPTRVGLAECGARGPAHRADRAFDRRGAFDEPLVREMAAGVDRPIIFPLSNPTAKSEAVPEDLLRWTEGTAIVATGSPFAPVEVHGVRVPIAQCNNVYIFPALGLGVVASGAHRVTDGMILAAARALADKSPARENLTAPLLPPVAQLRRVAVEVAMAVGFEAQRAGHALVTSPEELRERILATEWTPKYPTYREPKRLPVPMITSAV